MSDKTLHIKERHPILLSGLYLIISALLSILHKSHPNEASPLGGLATIFFSRSPTLLTSTCTCTWGSGYFEQSPMFRCHLNNYDATAILYHTVKWNEKSNKYKYRKKEAKVSITVDRFMITYNIKASWQQSLFLRSPPSAIFIWNIKGCWCWDNTCKIKKNKNVQGNFQEVLAEDNVPCWLRIG